MSTTKIHDRPVAVAGATGKQGGAVAHRLLARGHKVRALTRNPGKPVAHALAAKGAEVVRADLEDRVSLDRALAGAGALFSVQDFLEAGVQAERRQGLNLAEAAYLLARTCASSPGPGRPRSMGRDGRIAWVNFSQRLQAKRGRVIMFTTNRPGTYSSSSVASSPI